MGDRGEITRETERGWKGREKWVKRARGDKQKMDY